MKWTCKFSSYIEKTIVNHYKDKHGRGRTGFSCIYPNCLTVFQSHVELLKHLTDHKQGTSPVARLRCELCTFSAPSNIKHYFLHLKRHLIKRETVNCPFVGCCFTSRVASTSRKMSAGISFFMVSSSDLKYKLMRHVTFNPILFWIAPGLISCIFI